MHGRLDLRVGNSAIGCRKEDNDAGYSWPAAIRVKTSSEMTTKGR